MATWEQIAARNASRKIWLVEIDLSRASGSPLTKTLCLSGDGYTTEAGYTANPSAHYEGRLKGVPSFRRALQDALDGQTQVSFGTLYILNNDGGLDDDLAGWVWSGAAVRVLLGFDDSGSTDEFRTVFTGYAGQPSWSDAQISLPIYDNQARLTKKKPASQVYDDTLDNVLTSLLSTAGVTSIDTTLRTAWATANPFDVYYVTDGTESVATILDNLLAPMGCWWGFSRDGEFQIGTLTAPSGAAALTLGQDIEAMDYSARRDSRYWSMTISYWSTAGEERTTVSESDSAIEDLNPLALEGGERTTFLTSATDAATVLARVWALFGAVQRERVTVTAKVQFLGLTMHDVVSLARERYGLGSGEDFRVVGFREDYTNNRVELELWR